jgi:hypothetical protein
MPARAIVDTRARECRAPQDQRSQFITSPSFSTRDPIAAASSISGTPPSLAVSSARGADKIFLQNGIEPAFDNKSPMLTSLFPQSSVSEPDAVAPDVPGAYDNSDRNHFAYARITPSSSPDWSGPADGNATQWPTQGTDDVDAEQAHFIHPSAITGDARIDRTTEFLLDALEQSLQAMGPFAPPGLLSRVFGTYVHTDFGNRVRALDLPGIGTTGVEHTFTLGDFDDILYYGLPGSIPTDVVLKDRFGTPIANTMSKPETRNSPLHESASCARRLAIAIFRSSSCGTEI